MKRILADGTVTHGLMSRVFLMKWYHFSVEYFEDLRNVNHCEFLIMRKKEDAGKYILENNLRTWSELKRERLAALKEKEKAEKVRGIPASSPSSSTFQMGVLEKDRVKEKKSEIVAAGPVQVRKKWGGCPNGCDHSKHYHKKENSMHAMQINSKASGVQNVPPGAIPRESLPLRRPTARRWQSSSDEGEDDPRGRQSVDVQESLDGAVLSPGQMPSFVSAEDGLNSRLTSPRNDRLLLFKFTGRDFGGSASGTTSRAGSDTEFSAEEDMRKRLGKGGGKVRGKLDVTMDRGTGLVEADRDSYLRLARREESQMGRGAMANALGDQSDAGSELDEELEKELEREEKEDRSVMGSVY